MNPDEVILLYNITDPVYSGLIRWRMNMIREWQRKYFPGKLESILEIGTGNFPFSLALGNTKVDTSFVGIERDSTMAKRAALHLDEKFKEVTVRNIMWNDQAVENEFKGESYDLVSSFEVFEHVPASDHFIANVGKVLKPGGAFILETPNKQVTPLFQKVFGIEPNGAADYEGTEHVNELSFRALFQDLRDNGFEILDFDCYYLPVSLWKDAELPQQTQPLLYEYIHKAAGMLPFYSYVQAFLAVKK